ncbi:hypothetical protein KY290_030803 [Solanum tuberosum]|uniref:Uncharacterized protein n=1 Tax=Solanum tuberosum TaxID=4113 RepID=A0ABQ7U7B1_SOLTU|nr:hypothetical protein KY290_030803 [Solanum tuberosum]
MDSQSPSKRFTRGIHLHGKNSVEQPSFSLGLTQDFGEVADSMSKSNAMQEIISKLKNDPIRLEEMSTKSKQSNIRIVEGDDNAKRKEVVVSGSLEHDEAVKFLGKREPTRTPHMQCYTNIELVFQNLNPTPMELKILELPLEYVQSDQSPTEISAANDSNDDFQDPPHPKNNKGKEKVDTCSSPPKKKSRQTVTPIQKKTPPRVISKKPYLSKSPRHANVPKRPKSPLPKRQAKQCANVASYTGNKQNIEIKSSVASEIPSTSKSHNFSISRDEFDQFKISGDGVEVTHKVPTSPAGHSGFSPLGQQFNTPEPQVHNNSEVPITFEVQNTSEFSNIYEVQNTSEKEDCQDVPIEVNKEGSQFMNDQADFNNSSFRDLLNVIFDQTEKMEKEEFTYTNKSGSSDANKLVVEEVFMCPAPLQMVRDDQSNRNPERSMVLHPLLVVDEHTPLPIPRERRLGPINISPYVTSFGSESGSSSRFTFTFDLKHLFVSMSDVDLTTLLLVKHNTKKDKEERYKKKKIV